MAIRLPHYLKRAVIRHEEVRTPVLRMVGGSAQAEATQDLLKNKGMFIANRYHSHPSLGFLTKNGSFYITHRVTFGGNFVKLDKPEKISREDLGYDLLSASVPVRRRKKIPGGSVPKRA